MNRHNINDWLIEQDIPAAAAQGDPAAGQVPSTDANVNSPATQNPPPDPNVTNTDQSEPKDQSQNQVKDISSDPQAPEMPEDQEKHDDFETWKSDYLKNSIKGDSNSLLELLSNIRDKEGLTTYQRKFVEDNWNIQLIRQNSNVEKACREIRKNVKDQLDKTNPATSLISHITSVTETISGLNNNIIKIGGYGGLKGDLHRKYVSALIGGVQVGSGGNSEDIIYNEKEYSILISSRYNSRWGDVMIGNWYLKEEDPDRYLTEPELKRLNEGSPEEKDVLRRRIVMESISDLFETRAFIIHVLNEDGTIHALGWDLASCIRSAYKEGKLVVKTKNPENSEVMIDDNGKIMSYVDIGIYYVKNTNELDKDGKPIKKEIDFLDRRDGMLFLTASYKTLKEVSNILPGITFKEIPYNGNPSDLKTLTRCVFTSHDLIMRQC